MAGCCEEQDLGNATPTYKRALWAVVAINAVLAITELAAGAAAGSMALTADALDFVGDTMTYALSLWVLGQPLARRAVVALLKGWSLALMAVGVLGMSLWQAFVLDVPSAPVMGWVGALALAANVASVLILMRWRDGDANMRSVWLCSRNDAIGNVMVMGAAGAVFLTGSAWPDLIVAFLMAGLFLRSAFEIIARANGERRHAALHAS